MMIGTRGLHKSFGDHLALGGIDLDVVARKLPSAYAGLRGMGADLSNVIIG